MCGRFTLTRRDRRELAELLGVDEKDLRDYQPHYNIAPLQDHFVLRPTAELELKRGEDVGTDRRRVGADPIVQRRGGRLLPSQYRSQ